MWQNSLHRRALQFKQSQFLARFTRPAAFSQRKKRRPTLPLTAGVFSYQSRFVIRNATSVAWRMGGKASLLFLLAQFVDLLGQRRDLAAQRVDIALARDIHPSQNFFHAAFVGRLGFC